MLADNMRESILSGLMVSAIALRLGRDETYEGEEAMLALTQYTKRLALTNAARSVLAVVIAITALANIIALVKEFPWNSMLVTKPLIDLGGPAWERDGLIVTGALLLLVARALMRGKRQAWWLAVGLLAFSLASALAGRSERATIAMALGQLLLLLLLAPLFQTRSDTRALLRGYAALLLGIGCIAVYVAVSQLWLTAGSQAELSLRKGSLYILHSLTLLVLGYGVVKVLRPVRCARPRRAQEHARVYEVVRRHGSLPTVHFAQGRDKSYFWSETGRAVIAYRVIQGVAIALGDPIGPLEEYAPLLQAFLAFCRRQDLCVALFQASAQTNHLCQEWGLRAYKIGEDALIDAAHFTLQGKRGAPVRHAVARARRAGLFARCWQGETLPEAVFAGMQRISAQWLDTRKLQTQMGFSMGRFPTDWSNDLLSVVAFDSEGQVQAFLTWTPLYAGNGWALDSMRRGKETPPGAMELLIACAIEWAQDHDYRRMSLGLAPLAGLHGEMSATACDAIEREQRARISSLLERCAASLHRRGIILGAYRSLYAFKAKFQPNWEARYLIISEGKALPRILLALARVHGRGWWSMLQEAWGTARPLNTRMYAVARPMHAHCSPQEPHQAQGESRNSCEHRPVDCNAE